MNITILCSDPTHPINEHLDMWVQKARHNHNISFVRTSAELTSGDLLFLVSCSELIKAEKRNRYRHALVIHASDLPDGRGWSPHVWDVLLGKTNLTVSLINAEDSVDTGDIWKQEHIDLRGNELYDELNSLLFKAEIDLITWACTHIDTAHCTPQVQRNAEYYRKRTPADSEVDVNSSIAEQFNLLRVCDPNRFPAFFKFKGKRFKLTIERFDEQ